MRIFLFLVIAFMTTACTENARAKKFGGSASIKVPAGQKLTVVTWKDSNLWYLTRPMRKGEVPESYTFTEDSSWGMLEGTIMIVESARP